MREVIVEKLARELNLRKDKVISTIELIEGGNTIPFIARYRKEVTGNMSDDVLRDFDERLSYLINLEDRKEEVINAIDKQEKLTDELRGKILSCEMLKEVEDLYLPYKAKKRTRATIAKEKGLEPLSVIIFAQEKSESEIDKIAVGYIDEEKGVLDAQDAILGASDIIAEQISENAQYRGLVRSLSSKYGELSSTVTKEFKEEVNEFEMYYSFLEPIRLIPDHRILAINRGESKKVLKVSVEFPQDTIIFQLEKLIATPKCSSYLKNAILDSFKRLIAPSIEREIRTELRQRADESAITVFAKNLKALLMASPLKNKVIMGFDPAFRTGCKIAIVSAVGKLLDYTTVYPTAPQFDTEGATKVLKELIKKHSVEIISIGNGTASRESEVFVSELIKKLDTRLEYVIVNEAGASVYSASKLGAMEYPELNVSIRGAISIAQRLKDPLSELVKIDPKHIGVGQYQHDVNQTRLTQSLENVVEDAVNSVGVDINSASPALLSHVSGITKKTATALFDYVKDNGGIKNRKEILKVSGIGPKAYEQCAGFLRVSGGDTILDNTGVHPESYLATKKILASIGIDEKKLLEKESGAALENVDVTLLSKEVELGEYTIRDIITELKKPGRDPRDEIRRVAFKSEIMELKDLKEGMKLTGTVRNVCHFGAFVDLGVHEDGLVHISKLSKKFITDPFEVVKVGDIVDVTVLSIDLKRKRIGLSMVD